MSEYVLFSAVGGHDPIANYHDGALLHICRRYRPRKVYIYLSDEMLQRSRIDNRYCMSLKKLQKYLHYTIDEIKLIEKEGLTQVYKFDTFYEEFESIIEEIHTENPDSQILLNLSSGTPAMKNALNIIATLSQYKMLAVQVPTPNKGENPKNDNPDKFDLDLYWELNDDNKPNYKLRCEEVNSINLMAKIKKESIIRLVNAYDYNAAFSIAQDISDFVPKKCLDMLSAAAYRLQLDQSSYTKALTGNSFDFMPIKSGKKKEIFEYLLLLQVKQKQGNYSDFIRGLTPVVLDLFEECLKEQCGIDIKDYCKKVHQYNDNFIYKISKIKLKASTQGQTINKILCNYFSTNEIKEMAYSSAHIFPIIENMSKDYKFIEDLRKLRIIESRVRNIAAHEIVSVTESWIHNRIGIYSIDIVNLLRRVTNKAGLNVKKEYWYSYESMNKIIINSLK